MDIMEGSLGVRRYGGTAAMHRGVANRGGHYIVIEGFQSHSEKWPLSQHGGLLVVAMKGSLQHGGGMDAIVPCPLRV